MVRSIRIGLVVYFMLLHFPKSVTFHEGGVVTVAEKKCPMIRFLSLSIDETSLVVMVDARLKTSPIENVLTKYFPIQPRATVPERSGSTSPSRNAAAAS